MRPSRTGGAVASFVTASVLLATVGVPASSATSQPRESSPLGLTPITATFVPAEYATHYTVEATDLTGTPTFTWHLSLELVDKAGAPDPSNPGSGAAVDGGCTNNGYGITAKDTSHANEFIWHHPDAQNSTPPGLYHCNHQLEGPSGHQGQITVTVKAGPWTCLATYGGTNTGVGRAATCSKSVRTTSSTTTTSTTSTSTTTTTVKKKAAVIPKFSKAEKEKFKFLKHVYTFGSIATGVIALLLAEVPPLALGVGCLAASEAGSAEIYDIYSEDPPDPNFTVVAVPAPVTPPVIPAGTGLSAKAAAAVAAYATNILRLHALGVALITSVNRAQGATAAGAVADIHLQERAASTYANKSAALIAAQPALMAAFLGAVHHRAFTSSAVSVGVKQLAAQGFPPAVLSGLTAGGATSAQIAAMASQAVTISGALSLGSVLKTFAAPARQAAAELRIFARSMSALARSRSK